ncbi:hypothetical protein KP509_06G008400 [Ceratopteris richardii]|uniref:Uncharacterized protein n=1 Tax=Ceratopteris richardii TaxID=49495 RepID=A0A8T2UE29_CERRI|nr:hypothetical protein KP509_06G008400 [Ceratopteris richardii]KAH7434268.1 hypothetical protein KP509_06G008400 [Ceratopteris richardii]KAH7434269.1 hypothetical protein KP509_06G008400 [Ceratopteris richardii]
MDFSGDFSKLTRRRLRKKLKDELLIVQGLYSKLEVRAMQLMQSNSAHLQLSCSDAQFSVNDVSARRVGSSKEVTSQFKHEVKGRPPQVASFSKQNSTRMAKDVLFGAEFTGSTSVMSQVSKGPESLIGKGMLQSPVKPFTKLNKGHMRRMKMPNELRLPQLSNDSKTQCVNILKKLVDSEDGWIFNEPVDAIKLGLPDYHSVIKKPMDLGTIKQKLEKRQYRFISEFADDVRLTFHNAMSYNPPGNDVHESAKTLLRMFQSECDVIKEKLSKRNRSEELPLGQVPKGSKVSSKPNFAKANKIVSKKKKLIGLHSSLHSTEHIGSGRLKPQIAKSKSSLNQKTRNNVVGASSNVTCLKQNKVLHSSEIKLQSSSKGCTNFKAPAGVIDSLTKPNTSVENNVERETSLGGAKSSFLKRAMSYEEKVRLQSLLGQLPQHKLEELIDLIRERNINMRQEGDEIEVDLDSFDDATLWELDRQANDCFRKLQKGSKLRKQPRESNHAETMRKRGKVNHSHSSFSSACEGESAVYW